MKFWHCFLIFGLILATSLGGILAKNAAFEARLPRYEYQYAPWVDGEPDYDTFQYIEVDGMKYYRCDSKFVPLEIRGEPFGRLGYGRYKEYLHWVGNENGKWIYKASARYQLALGSVLRREDVKEPSLEEVTVCWVGISDLLSSPVEEQRNVTPVLEGEWARALAEDMLESEQDASMPEEIVEQDFPRPPPVWFNWEFFGTLQLRCEEYPGMAFEYQLYENPDGGIFVHGALPEPYPLSDEYSDMIKEAREQRPN